MKRNGLLAALIILGLLLVACAGGTPSNVSQEAGVQIPESSREEEEAQPEEPANEFGMTRRELYNELAAMLDGYSLGEAQAPDISAIPPQTKEAETDEYGPLTAFRYPLNRGISLTIITDEANNVRQVSYLVNTNRMATTDYAVLGYVSGCVIDVLAQEQADEIAELLNFYSLDAQTVSTSAEAERLHYTYTWRDGVRTLHVVPIGADILPMELFAFEDDLAGEGISGEEFIERIDRTLDELGFTTIAGLNRTPLDDAKLMVSSLSDNLETEGFMASITQGLVIMIYEDVATGQLVEVELIMAYELSEDLILDALLLGTYTRHIVQALETEETFEEVLEDLTARDSAVGERMIYFKNSDSQGSLFVAYGLPDVS